MPYKDPDLYVNMAPSKRQTGKVEAWTGRLSNVFMLSQNAIRTREHHAEQIKECIAKLINDGYIKNKVVFICPSFPIKARVLQAVYPKIHFAFLNVYEQDSYFDLHNTKFSTEYDLEDILERSILLTSKELYEKYLMDSSLSLLYKSRDIICLSTDNDIQSIIELYYKYYIRSD
jgi:hypothetical protein